MKKREEFDSVVLDPLSANPHLALIAVVELLLDVRDMLTNIQETLNKQSPPE